jgi:hypothetical protein
MMDVRAIRTEADYQWALREMSGWPTRQSMTLPVRGLSDPSSTGKMLASVCASPKAS